MDRMVEQILIWINDIDNNGLVDDIDVAKKGKRDGGLRLLDLLLRFILQLLRFIIFLN